jgi:hypothetical protein
MSFYESNISVLESRFPGISTTLGLEPGPLPDGWEPVQAADGNPSARLSGAAIHSLRAPRKEAAKVVRASGAQEGLFCLYGFGLGYVAEAALAEGDRYVAVVEPRIERFRAALRNRDLTQLLANERLSLILDPEPGGLLAFLGAQPPTALVWLPLTAIRNADGDLHDRFHQAFQRRSGRQDVNRNTLSRFGRSWVRNLAANLRDLAQAGPVSDWTGRFANSPALLVAAGPSLSEVLPYLSELARRMPIIAVDTAYRACLAAGVTPDFLVVVDPQYWNTRHLDACDTRTTVLISESSTHPAVFRHGFRAKYFCSSIFPLGRYLEPFTRVRGELGAGGSVSTTAWDFVRLTGARPIYIAGLDLGFPGLQTHFRGGYFEQRMVFLARRMSPGENLAFHALRDGDPYLIPSNDGNMVLTDRRLVIYKWWFEERLAEHPDCDTRNLSGRGVAISGMPVASVKDALEHRSARDRLDSTIADVLRLGQSELPSNGTPGHEMVRGVNALLEELEELELLCVRTLEIVEATRRKMAEGLPIAAEIASLETADARIQAAKGKDVLGFLIHPALEALSNQESSLDASEVLYRELRQSAAFHRAELEKQKGRLGAST